MHLSLMIQFTTNLKNANKYLLWLSWSKQLLQMKVLIINSFHVKCTLTDILVYTGTKFSETILVNILILTHLIIGWICPTREWVCEWDLHDLVTREFHPIVMMPAFFNFQCIWFGTLLTLHLGRRAAITGEVSVKPYPFCTFTPIACMLWKSTNVK